MKKFKKEHFLNLLSKNLDWICESDSLEEKLGILTKKINETVYKLAPLRMATRKEKCLSLKLWITLEMLKSIRKKNKMYVRVKKNSKESEINQYKSYRNALNLKIAMAKRSFYQNKISNNKDNPKKFGKR